MSITVLDGPLGTELEARGVAIELPRWSAAAIDPAAQVIAAIHRDYRLAGATIHTANTFRTKRRNVGDQWQRLTGKAVSIAIEAAAGQTVAGSISPLEDCYRPDLSPADPRPEHREMAASLAAAGCDLLLCETFPHVGEAVIATEEAAATGLPVWTALTAGPAGDLLSPRELCEAGKRCVAAGASAVLVNCVAAARTLPFIEALQRGSLGVPLGGYANAGSTPNEIGWSENDPRSVDRYLDYARQWIEAGASIIGGCCGTGPAHIAAIAQLTNR